MKQNLQCSLDVEDTVVNVEDTVVNVKDTVVNVKDTVVNVKDTVVNVKDTVVTVKDTVVNVKDTVVDVKDTAVEIADVVKEDNNQLLQNNDTSWNQEKEPAYFNNPLLAQVNKENTQYPKNSNSTNSWIHNFSKLKNKIFNKHLFRPHPSLSNYFQITRNHQHQEPTDTNSEVNNQNNISPLDPSINLGLKEIKQQIPGNHTPTQTIQVLSNFEETILIPPPPVPPDIRPMRKNVTIKLEFNLLSQKTTNQIKANSFGRLCMNTMAAQLLVGIG
ncbi:hypothetical protein MJO28_012440 [Puccinia striiformis f. sp. tritici]|uniref:Uncharacterized protein n=2 Tax=Puccinia striiformis f. sp. tritici TaxID=168172 RepID=A0A0L0VR76_9BASI|nr:hypothetical protein Pst134EA_022656 [Puccinia striiformis f. sp. tritici]KAI9610767.1 hypothetical protein KEM48_004743 [Puccinia striiformis f. sp. tritici PST-130]KNF01485.1 hypothetical protein PSTG_05265 [Puccinia striiformis f. sp. tritici PST-78]KAH9455180.1 hypothetical protein Pst134EA_022656 [Puccinia striiformis f. sp. tritici]KAI7942413.1 hypothetical protein MJO28_012440 [Puccinia striiformis f. sp. tritici]KAI7945591.1 hypothetical protein MJO29_011979 [Puccinia striiformis f.